MSVMLNETSRNANPSLWLATVAVFASAALALTPTPTTTKMDALPESGNVLLLGATKEKYNICISNVDSINDICIVYIAHRPYIGFRIT
jgi:hypothetical protein